MKAERTINILVAGLGGQGVIKASDIIAEAAFRAGYDVKKSELHGMSQRGGSVSSDVRFGREVLSPMIPAGEADFLVALAPGEIENNRPMLRPGGVILAPAQFEGVELPSKRCLNTAMLGMLSQRLPIPPGNWREALEAAWLAPEALDANLAAFEAGRALGGTA